MSSEQTESGFGSFIHNILPEQLHVDPYRSEVVPSGSLERMASSGRDFKNLFSSPESTPVQEEANSPSPTAVREETAEPNEGVEEELITPVDEENEAHHVERNVTHSFGNFIYDIYEASSYGQPLTHNPPLNRLQYMQEYYRRMVQLLEASQRMEPASEETIRNLCIAGSLFCGDE